ncbi:MAG: hypothetical protein ACXVZ3_10380 [Gaiellaceae bacterium]
MPLFSLALGFVFLGIQWANGDPGSGLVSLGIMAAFGALFLFGGRSETIRGLRGDGRDERFQRIDVNATAFAGFVLIVYVIVGFTVELPHGDDGSPYGLMGAAAGLAYVAAIVWQRARS